MLINTFYTYLIKTTRTLEGSNLKDKLWAPGKENRFQRNKSERISEKSLKYMVLGANSGNVVGPS